jgi:hypothetical protein
MTSRLHYHSLELSKYFLKWFNQNARVRSKNRMAVSRLDVELDGLCCGRLLHDELVACRRVLAHEFAEDAIRL